MSNGQRSSREGGAEPINSFDLRCDIQFNTRVTSAVYDNTTNHWMTQTEQGEQIAARYCITAVGCLSTPNIPAFKGPETFTGQVYHTSRWPHEGVIGTGSTGIQAIPRIAKQAEHVTVFQRTPTTVFRHTIGPSPLKKKQALRPIIPRCASRIASLRQVSRSRAIRSRPLKSQRKNGSKNLSKGGNQMASRCLPPSQTRASICNPTRIWRISCAQRLVRWFTLPILPDC